MRYGDYEVRQTSITGFNNTRNAKKETQGKSFIPLVQKQDSDNDKVQGYYIEPEDKATTTAPAPTETTQVPDAEDKQKTSDAVAAADDDDDSDNDEGTTAAESEEATQEADDKKGGDDDTMDHEVDPSVRIHANQSIAKHSIAANPIKNALNDAMYQDLSDGDESGKGYVQAMEMNKENTENDPLTDVSTDNKISVYGKVIGEVSNYTAVYEDNKQKITSHTEKFNFGLTWGKKTDSGSETKAMLYGYFVKNKDSLKLQMKENDDETSPEENPEIDTDNEALANNAKGETDIDEESDEIAPAENVPEEVLQSDFKSTDFKIFAAASHKFKNKDELSGSALLYKDDSTATTLNITSTYKSQKYHAYAQADVSIYMDKAENDEPKERETVITSLKVGFNPDAEEADDDYHDLMDNNAEQNEEPAADEQTKDNNIETEQEEGSSNTESDVDSKPEENTPAIADDKKWSCIRNPYLITRTIAGEPSTGFGFEKYFKRKSDNSRLTLGYFAQGSITYTTNDENQKSQDYHLAFGGNLKHVTRLNNGILESKIKIRDKYTICKSNIFTASGSVQYSTSKLNAEISTEYINVPKSDYIGVDARLFYNVSEKISTFLDANYVHLKEEDMIKGTTIQAGVVINL